MLSAGGHVMPSQRARIVSRMVRNLEAEESLSDYRFERGDFDVTVRSAASEEEAWRQLERILQRDGVNIRGYRLAEVIPAGRWRAKQPKIESAGAR
jgi:hypothetical protein